MCGKHRAKRGRRREREREREREGRGEEKTLALNLAACYTNEPAQRLQKYQNSKTFIR